MRNGMVTTMLTPFMLATRECAVQMMSNACYMLNELPNVNMPPELLERTRGVCNELIGTKHDLITELFDLDELVASDASDEKVGERVQRIVRWAHDDLVKVHGIVSALDELSKRDVQYSLASLLVVESATNLLNEFHQMRTTADGVMRAVQGAQGIAPK